MSTIFPPLDEALPCAVDPELFTRDKWCGPEARWQIRAARILCATCPFAAECLADAYAKGDTETIRGGLTPKQRARRKGRAAA